MAAGEAEQGAATVSADDVPAATAVLVPEPHADTSAGRWGLLILVSCVAIWGVNAVAFKVAQRPPAGGPGLDPVMLNGVRFLLVAPLLTLLVWWRRPAALRISDRRDLWRYALFGFVSILLGESLPAAAVRYTSVANMTLLGPGTISLFTALWAVALKEQRLTRSGWVGAGVATLGVSLVASAGVGGLRFGGESLVGDAISLGRSATQGLYLLFLTRTLRERSVLTVSVYNVIFGALWFLPYVLWKAPSVPWGRIHPSVWAAVAWTVLPTTVYGFLAWNWAMRRVGAVAATNVMYLLPVFGALAAFLILGEPLRTGQILGGLVIVAGIVALRWDSMLGAGFTLNLPRLRLPWRR